MWDIKYYINKYKENNFKLDEEELRYYFPIKHVIEKMFKITNIRSVNVEYKKNILIACFKISLLLKEI